MCITHRCQKGFLQRKNRARYLSGPDRVVAEVCFLALHDIQLGGYVDIRLSEYANELADAMGHKKARNSLKLRAMFATIRWLSNYLFN